MKWKTWSKIEGTMAARAADLRVNDKTLVAIFRLLEGHRFGQGRFLGLLGK
jgi:hypothetical protein